MPPGGKICAVRADKPHRKWSTRVIFWRRAVKAPPAPDVHERIHQFWQALEPLGPFRQQVISCLYGTPMSKPPNRFVVNESETLFEAFRRFVTQREATAQPELVPFEGLVLAAGRLLTGDLAGADRIIDLLPETPHVTDHGAGKCLLMPARVLRSVLPLPNTVGDPDRWTAASPEQRLLRIWLAQNRAQLNWVESAARYRLAAANS